MITAHDAAQSGDWKTFFASCLSDPLTYQQKQISFEESLELDYDTLDQLAEEYEPEEYGETLSPRDRNPNLANQ